MVLVMSSLVLKGGLSLWNVKERTAVDLQPYKKYKWIELLTLEELLSWLHQQRW